MKSKRPIGTPDREKYLKIYTKYFKLVDDLNLLHEQFVQLLPKSNTYQDFMAFISSNEPYKWLLNAYAKEIEDKHPGMNPAELIRQNIIKVDPWFHECLLDHAAIQKTLNEIKEDRYFYPLHKLFKVVKDEDADPFILSGFFKSNLERFCSRYCETQEQEKVLDALELMADGLNRLYRLKWFNPRIIASNWLGKRFSDLFILRRKETVNPVVVNPDIFKSDNFRNKTGHWEPGRWPEYKDMFALPQTQEVIEDQK